MRKSIICTPHNIISVQVKEDTIDGEGVTYIMEEKRKVGDPARKRPPGR
jgi:hypothetical protein